MNIILKSFGQSVAFLMFDAALSIFLNIQLILEKNYLISSSFLQSYFSLTLWLQDLKNILELKNNNCQNVYFLIVRMGTESVQRQ